MTAFLDALPLAARRELFDVGRLTNVIVGETLFRYDDLNNQVYLLLDGWAKGWAYTDYGGHALVRLYRPRELIGAEPALIGYRLARQERVTSATMARVLAVAGSWFAEFLRHHPDASGLVNRSLIGRLHEADQRLAAVAVSHSASQRLAQVIYPLIKDAHPDREGLVALPVPLTQEELGWLAGLSRVSVTRVLRQWRQQGRVLTGYRDLRFPVLEWFEASGTFARSFDDCITDVDTV
ncbi:hypothetical protein GCM10009678_86480 [Actinomadura kijaniata]|uniref:CRP-like cAMP-binding protein n=1 Tax=Actinomadura namibiensis TaxID=182080 RepID=A0A7W3M0V3_ACTNM|nr:Crp/Fnr family transcriptional regulator [Actinomadura namibiensis]MBA8957735.1 CRP-like cAMP-binding protein [Actinomadura namibiensis]